MSEITVIGAGYVGLVTASCLAELGHRVTCLEINPERVAALRRGELPIYEPGLDELVLKHAQCGNLTFSTDYAESIPGARFVFIAVNTPPLADGSANTDYVFASVKSALEYATAATTLVIKSTVPVSTGDQVAARVRESEIDDVAIVSNPEFLRQGSAVFDFLHPDRIVIGGTDEDAMRAVGGLYATLDAPMFYCSRASAELAKYASNALLATRISFMNEIASLCDVLHADVEDVAQIVGADVRIGPSYLRAGLGWGGSCFPKDVQALSHMARMQGHVTPLIEAVYEVNRRQRSRGFERIFAKLADIPEPRVGVLGLAFKPHTDDLRESPAIEIISRLLGEGVYVQATTRLP